MPFLAAAAPLIGSGISALAGLFGGKKQNETQQNQSTTQNYNNNSTATSTPNLNPFQQQLSQLFTQGAIDQYQKGTNLAPYTQQGLQQIQGQGTANNKMLSNILAQRGLSFSPAAATGLTQNAINSGNQMSSFLSGVPLLQRQLQTQSLEGLMNAFRTMPIGMTQTGTSSGTSTGTSTGTGTQSGNPAAGFFGGLGAGLFAPNQSGGSGSNLSGILDLFKPRPVGLPGGQY
jgi:hypothetical protein